jgi:hypothetical protein
MDKGLRLIGLAGLAILLCGTPVFGHHSFAAFDMQKTITLTGTVKEFQWLNPHSWIQMTVKDAAGNSTDWSIEPGPAGLETEDPETRRSGGRGGAPDARRAARRFAGDGDARGRHQNRRQSGGRE